MLHPDHTTLTEFLIEERRRHPRASGDLNGVITSVALACKVISREVAAGSLTPFRSEPAAAARPIAERAREAFLSASAWGGYVAGIASATSADAHLLAPDRRRGKYLLLIEPMDGANHIDVNVAVGSIFSVLRAPQPGADPTPEAFLQMGTEQVAAGYAIYGPATLLVLTMGNGTHAFTLDPQLGEFLLSHQSIRVPEDTREFAINASRSRFWEYPIRRYVDECMAGRTGPREKDFTLRWISSPVAEAHRILMRGGVFLCPQDGQRPEATGKLQLACQANPLGMLIEQAGGRASTGSGPLSAAKPESLHARVGLVFGSANEVGRIERYHREGDPRDTPLPLFNRRGLFASA